MPKGLQAHAAERVDLVDFTRGVRTFTQDSNARVVASAVLDNQARYLRGFRIELPSQTSFPGRVVIHGGDANDPSGRRLLNEDQSTVSRTITLEGATTDFYLEIEFIEGDGDVDARAFWDPTVDQGLDTSGDALPDGQEFSDNVATRKVPDWRVVTPINTTAFERTSNPESTKIPLALLSTDGSNQITAVVNTNLVTENPATTLLEVRSTILIRVQDAQLFLASNDVVVGEGAASQETGTISTVDVGKGLITLSGALVNSHDPGEICRAADAGASALDVITESTIGRYRRDEVTPPPAEHEIDVRDKLFQGDEVHGDILNRAHSGINDKSDVNLQSLKDYVDFLSGQIAEMKWGVSDPYLTGTDTDRTPPGLPVALPTVPRYFDRAGGIAGARTATVTVGDGVTSFGDFNGTTEAAINAAVTALPSTGGKIVLGQGVWTLGAPVTLGSKAIEFVGQGIGGTIIGVTSANHILLTSSTAKSFRHINFAGLGANAVSLKISTSPNPLIVEGCQFADCIIEVDTAMSNNCWFRDCVFDTATHITTSAIVVSTAAAGTISGVWDTCHFLHIAATGAAAAAFNTNTNASGFDKCDIRNCKFQINGGSAGSILVGTTTDGLHIDKCTFERTAGTSTHHVNAPSGGTQIRITNCQVVDTVAGILNATNIITVEVTGCDLNANSTSSLSTAPILVQCSSGDVYDYFVSHNTIIGDATNDNTIGVMFDLTGGISFRGIRVTDNEIRNCEVGIYFANSGAAAVYDGVTISRNHIYDVGVSASVADTMKLGIFAETAGAKARWEISNNTIMNVNPATATTIGGIVGRNGIWIGGVVSSSTVSDNKITDIGNSANLLDETSGITFGGQCFFCGIRNNVIVNVDGEDAYGIRMSVSAPPSNCNVVGNVIQTISTGAGGTNVYGIWSSQIATSSISGNQFSALSNAGGGSSSVCIGLRNITGSVDDVAISGNVANLSDSDVDFVNLDVLNIRGLSITGNSVFGTLGSGIDLNSQAAGTFKNVSINGNTFSTCTDAGIRISGTTIHGTLLSICGNIIDNSTQACITTSEVDQLSISGNTLETASTTTACIEVDDTELFVIISNATKRGNGTNDNILVLLGCDKYVINGNICDGGGGTGNSIDTSGATPTANAAVVLGNIIDEVANQSASDRGTSFIAASPAPGNY